MGIAAAGSVASCNVGAGIEVGIVAGGSVGSCGAGVGAAVHDAIRIASMAKEPATTSFVLGKCTFILMCI